MLLLFPMDGRYPRRPLPPAPYLTDEPREATAALEAVVRACPNYHGTGRHARPTYTQRQELGEAMESGYLTHREAVWLEVWQVEFDADTMTQALAQVQRIVSARQASGGGPVRHEDGWFWPEAPAPAPTPAPTPARPRRTYTPRKPRARHD